MRLRFLSHENRELGNRELNLKTDLAELDFGWRNLSGTAIQPNIMISRNSRVNRGRLNSTLNHQMYGPKSGNHRRFDSFLRPTGPAIRVKVIAGDANDGGLASR